MSENFTTNEKVAIFDRLYSYFTDPMGHDDPLVERELEKAKAENEKLRELVRRYGEYTGQDRCEGCVCKSRCNDGDVDECWQLTEIRGLARELGIEVQA